MKKHRDGKFLLNKQSKFTFVAPDETEYSNIQSLNAFAKEHGLSQPSVSQLRSGWIDSVRGWTLKGGNLPKVGRVVRYWPLSRVMKTYSFDERKSAASYVYKVHKINIVSADE